MQETNFFQKLGQNAYFIVDSISSQTRLLPYDPVLANQAILGGWDDQLLIDYGSPQEEEQEQEQE